MIPEGWKVTTLGEIAEIVMGQSPSGEKCNNDATGVPLLNGPTEFGHSYPIPVQFTTDPKKISRSADILFCVRGSTTGRMNWSNSEYAIGRGLAAIRHKEGPDFGNFIKGIIDLQLNQILSNATGSTFPNVSREQLMNLQILIPTDTSEQLKIASILSSLDNKIELNLQMNKTLEAIAQAIFKEWFIDFRFSGFDGVLVDGLPKGWKEGTLGDIIIYKNGKTSPERDDKGDYPVYGANGIIGYSDNYNAECNVTVIGRVGSFCGLTYFSQTRSWITDNAIVASPKTSSSTFTFIRLKSLNLNSFRGGSGQPLINQTVLSGIKTKIPDDSFLNLFEDTLLPIYKKIEFNEKQNLTLTLLRDTLLPKLMTGKIKVA